MRLSCSGCRVLRKGCSDDCSIRPCLEWIKSPQAQANATVFLAKFYGRAGLVNLINSGADHLRPAIFRSLLYEACGRILNPIYGSVGLMWSGNWNLCETAVEAVLKGDPITPMATDAAEAKAGPAMKAYDIRHVNKEENSSGSTDLRRVKNRTRFKRSGAKSKRTASVEETSHDSSLSHQSETVDPIMERAVASAEPASEHLPVERDFDLDDEIELDLTLGFEPVKRWNKVKQLNHNDAGEWADGDGAGVCKMQLGLDYTVGRAEIGLV